MRNIVKPPNRFHIHQLNLNTRILFDVFEVTFEVRELMKIYRLLKKRGERNISDKIERFLNSLAKTYGYKNFNINEDISTKKVGVIND